MSKAAIEPPSAPPWDDAPAASADHRGDAYREAILAFGDVAGALGHVKDLDELLHLIARKICDLSDIGRCSVYLRDESTGL